MVISNRAPAAPLARLREGYALLLKAYANLLELPADPLWPLCKEDPQTIENWLRRCFRLDASGQDIFGSLSRTTQEPLAFGAEASTAAHISETGVGVGGFTEINFVSNGGPYASAMVPYRVPMR